MKFQFLSFKTKCKVHAIKGPKTKPFNLKNNVRMMATFTRMHSLNRTLRFRRALLKQFYSSIIFLSNFQHSWKVCKNSVCLAAACLSFRGITRINKLALSWKWYMSLRFTMPCWILKMNCVAIYFVYRETKKN